VIPVTQAASEELVSALKVALPVTVAYAVWAAHTLTRWSPVDLALLGRHFLAQGHGHSEVIDGLSAHAYTRYGYDGQSALYLALDPGEAHHYVDLPAYRSSRFLYPLLGRVLGAGQPGAIPLMLVLINVAAVVVATFLLALLLRRRGASPWFALLYGLSPAAFICVDRDLHEPLAYALVIGAMAAFLADRLVLTAILLGLAGVARETTLLFGLGLVVALAFGLGVSKVRPARLAVLATAMLAPYALARLGLYLWLGADPPAEARYDLIPFRGLITHGSSRADLFGQVAAVVAPAFLALALVAMLVRRISPEVLVLALNVLLITLLEKSSYAGFHASGRIAMGVLVAFLLCLPLVRRPTRTGVALLLAMLWFLPWASLAPYAAHA
jgi:hypothetical protein